MVALFRAERRPDVEQLVNERDALAGLAFVDQFEGEGVMLHRRYRFQPQDHGFDQGTRLSRPGPASRLARSSRSMTSRGSSS
jgi:hypothetical protein